MKTIVITILGILAIFVFVQAYVTQSTNNTEQQEYEVMETDRKFEIRYYPSATMASVDVNGTYRNSSGSGFQVLAGYIFGSNDEDKKIAMTAPVHMKEGDTGFAMSFVMPSGYDTSNLPIPDNSNIRIHEAMPVYTASIGFGGFASDESIENNKQQLIEYLNEKEIRYSGPFTYLGYNPPYQMTNRRNEVMVQIAYTP